MKTDQLSILRGRCQPWPGSQTWQVSENLPGLRRARIPETQKYETDLETLTGEVVRIVEESVQPDGVSVWLLPSRPAQ